MTRSSQPPGWTALLFDGLLDGKQRLPPSSPNKLHPADWHASSPRPWSWSRATAAHPTFPLLSLSRDLCHGQKLMKRRVHRTRLVVCCCQVEDKWRRRWTRHGNKCTSLALIAHRSLCLLRTSEDRDIIKSRHTGRPVCACRQVLARVTTHVRLLVDGRRVSGKLFLLCRSPGEMM